MSTSANKTIFVSQPKTKESKTISYAYSIILVSLISCQLLTFDGFSGLLVNFMLPGGIVTAHIISYVIVLSEVLALPFLLRLKLWFVLRYISMIFCWLVPIIWLFLTLWLNLSVNSISNVGFLGTVVQLLPGWWSVCLSLSIGLMAIWASWGLWPNKSSKY
jgi:hypothetical protein